MIGLPTAEPLQKMIWPLAGKRPLLSSILSFTNKCEVNNYFYLCLILPNDNVGNVSCSVLLTSGGSSTFMQPRSWGDFFAPGNHMASPNDEICRNAAIGALVVLLADQLLMGRSNQNRQPVEERDIGNTSNGTLVNSRYSGQFW